MPRRTEPPMPTPTPTPLARSFVRASANIKKQKKNNKRKRKACKIFICMHKLIVCLGTKQGHVVHNFHFFALFVFLFFFFLLPFTIYDAMKALQDLWREQNKRE